MTTKSAPLRFAFLEGLRALAMLVVLNFHACTAEDAGARGGLFLPLLQRYSLHGQVGVVIFIVLSGYCLMLPVARSGEGALRGGLPSFFRRRALRILPAYYAALALSIALPFAVTVLHSRLHTGTRSFANVLTARNIVTHLTMTHNLWFDTAFTLNGAMWSVATEWQIYFVFALPLWRRFGMLAAFLVAFVAGILPSLLLPEDQNFYWARPWYLGLFALGMAGAVVNFRAGDGRGESLRPLPFRGLFLVSLAAVVILYACGRLGPSWPVDTLIGFCAVTLIAWCVESRKAAVESGHVDAGAARITKVLEHPALVYLASISYSVYLLQHIFFKGIATVAESRHVSPTIHAALNYAVAIPVCLFCSHWFARVFERPFTSHSAPKRVEADAQASAALPA